MKRKYDKFYYFMLMGLFIVSMTNLVNRFIIDIPDPISITLAFGGCILMVVSSIGHIKANRKNQ